MKDCIDILNKVGLSAFIIDNDNNIVVSTNAFTDKFMLYSKDITGKKCYDILLSIDKECKTCPIKDGRLEKVGSEIGGCSYELLDKSGKRIVVDTVISKVDENNYLITIFDVTKYHQTIEETTHIFKETKALKTKLVNELHNQKAVNKLWHDAINSVHDGFMIVDSKYAIMNINTTLKSLSQKADFKNIRCYGVYGYDKPCKDCPFTNKGVAKSLRNMNDKNMTVYFSEFENYLVESLRDTTRELKLIEDIKSQQREIGEKQRQMTILNTDLLRMNEKLKAVQLVIDEELKQVGHIQESLLPKELPEVNGYQFGAKYIPAEHAGGDYYDCIIMSNDYIGFLVADVSGHGTPAAVIMAITRAIMRSYTYDIISSSEALAMVNDILCDNIYTKDFVTMLYTVMNTRTDNLNYASAGHNPALLFDASEYIVRKISASGMFLGAFDKIDFEEKNLTLDNGDILFMYTDGLVEAMNGKREQYGYDRVISKLTMFSSLTPDAIINEIMIDVEEFVEGHKFEDDITIFVIKKL